MDDNDQNSGQAGLDSFERKMLCKIYGAVNENGHWIRFNHELYDLHKEPRLSVHIKLMRLRWAGHVQRMPNMRVPKKALIAQPGGKRPVRKPRLRWEESVARDARELLNVRSWRSASGNREEWKRKIEEARARLGL